MNGVHEVWGKEEERWGGELLSRAYYSVLDTGTYTGCVPIVKRHGKKPWRKLEV